MKILWSALGGVLGIGVGAAVGFGLALLLAKPRSDGSFGMREMIVGLPSGAIIGLVAGVLIAVRLTR